MTDARDEQTFWVAWGGVQKQVDGLSQTIQALQRDMPAALERGLTQLQAASREDREQLVRASDRLRQDFFDMIKERDLQHAKETARQEDQRKEDRKTFED